MSNGLAFGANNKKLTGVATLAGENYVTITARTDGTVTYTETYNDDNTTEIFTAETISAGQTMYGLFSIISAPTGHIVVGR